MESHTKRKVGTSSGATPAKPVTPEDRATIAARVVGKAIYDRNKHRGLLRCQEIASNAVGLDVPPTCRSFRQRLDNLEEKLGPRNDEQAAIARTHLDMLRAYAGQCSANEFQNLWAAMSRHVIEQLDEMFGVAV